MSGRKTNNDIRESEIIKYDRNKIDTDVGVGDVGNQHSRPEINSAFSFEQ